NINTNNYNNFNKTNIANGNWQHNVDHRKGVQYRDKATQQRYGRGQAAGAQSRDQFRGRAEQGRQQIARGAANEYKAGGREGGREAGQGRGGAQQRDEGRQGQQRDAGQRGGQQQRDMGQRQGQQQRDMGQRQGQQQRAGGREGGMQGARDTGRSPGAYQGMGNGQQARAQSQRGAAS